LTTDFIEVIVPQSLPNTFTYRVPKELQDAVQCGIRVVVPFGKSKLTTAIVCDVNTNVPTEYQAKYIDTVLDEQPIIYPTQLDFWRWISTYYLCNIGDVLNAALPSGLKLSSEGKYLLNPNLIDATGNLVDTETAQLTDKEYLVAEALSVKSMLTIDEIRQILNLKNVHKIIKSLFEKNAIYIEQQVVEKFKPKLEYYVSLNEKYAPDAEMQTLMQTLEKRAYKQVEVLMQYLKIINFDTKNLLAVNIKTLLEGVEKGEAALTSLIKKEIFFATQKQKDRFHFDGNVYGLKVLSHEQNIAYENIKNLHQQKDVVLLHGVTGSGKTEIYCKLIHDAILQGKQVLYMLPEIALTTQIIVRLQKVFGEAVGVYHSRQNENERVEVWNRVLNCNENNSYKIILGARSSLFLPFSNLGLVIVDEENDFSYKQHDPAPRYHGRDTAIYLAHLHKAKVVLGTATPAIETYYNASTNKFGLVNLNLRFGNAVMPQTELVDMKKYKKEKGLNAYFSKELLHEIAVCLKDKKQAILFQNRRGFAPMLECRQCAHIPYCINCDVSLTYHKNINILRCHYCGYTTPPPQTCAKCGSTEVLMKGAGTEKIEEELQILFPEALIARMDLDTTRSKYAFQQLIYDFEEGNFDILVGTQMVSKGLDFANVSLVGVINADALLHYPDFRSFERCFQLLVQVSGRAGRSDFKSKVIIQTSVPNNPIFEFVTNNYYKEFYATQIAERQLYHYPPFSKLIELNFRSKDINELNVAAQFVADNLRTHFGKMLLGPEFPSIAKIRNFFHKNILIKIDKDVSASSSKKLIAHHAQQFRANKEYNKVRLYIDVDVM